MAFRQPSVAAPRQVPTSNAPVVAGDVSASTRLKSSQDLREWVLFSPSQVQTLSLPQSTATARSAELSRLSDFGSLNKSNRSGKDAGSLSEAIDGETAAEEEDLDSLDEGLHAFQDHLLSHHLRYAEGIGSILPKHDGFGTFPASSSPVQDQIRQFEQHDPPRRAAGNRRPSSVVRQLDAVSHDDISRAETERMARVEIWSIEQSKILLDSVQREAGQRRRRRRACPSNRGCKHDISATRKDGFDKGFSRPWDREYRLEKCCDEVGEMEVESDEPLLERITRRLIRDLLGIDDLVLSVILGESLPEESSSLEASPMSSKSIFRLPEDSDPTIPIPGLEGRLFDRLGRELGILVEHLSDHPGAFSTLPDAVDLDYAGVPVSFSSPQDQQRPSAPPAYRSIKSSSSISFRPTIESYLYRPSTATSETTHAALWGIEEETASSGNLDDGYWERTPGLVSIFRVLHHRFSSPRRAPTSTPTIATTATPAFLHRTAVIRQHHPLVSPAAAAASSRRTRSVGIFRRTESSCKSLSNRKGGRAISGSSRNYWDLGEGSAGGSVAGSALGAWGEV